MTKKRKVLMAALLGWVLIQACAPAKTTSGSIEDYMAPTMELRAAQLDHIVKHDVVEGTKRGIYSGTEKIRQPDLEALCQLLETADTTQFINKIKVDGFVYALAKFDDGRVRIGKYTNLNRVYDDAAGNSGPSPAEWFVDIRKQ